MVALTDTEQPCSSRFYWLRLIFFAISLIINMREQKTSITTVIHALHCGTRHGTADRQCRSSFRGIKGPGWGGDNSPPSRGEIKNEWGWKTLLLIRFRGVERNIFTFQNKLPHKRPHTPLFTTPDPTDIWSYVFYTTDKTPVNRPRHRPWTWLPLLKYNFYIICLMIISPQSKFLSCKNTSIKNILRNYGQRISQCRTVKLSFLRGDVVVCSALMKQLLHCDTRTTCPNDISVYEHQKNAWLCTQPAAPVPCNSLRTACCR